MDVAALLRLTIRRRGPGYVYCDCPVCGDHRGKTKLFLDVNTWHCYHCGEGGGMLSLYGKACNLDNSAAYREICESLLLDGSPAASAASPYSKSARASDDTPQADRAPPETIHQTYAAMLSMLRLSAFHREHLRTKRGLTDEQIDAFGFRSTPPSYQCRAIAEQLMKHGYTIEGVPGFYMDDKDCWTVRFFSKTAGIIIPMHGIDGKICGLQTRLDHPIKDKDAPPDKEGTKYLSLSSAGKKCGVSCGALVHFVGDPNARVVYVTEGGLKADIAHALTNRTFLATVGVNSLGPLDEIFAFLKKNGTEEIIEAEDMDKFRKPSVNKGAAQIYLLAKKHGLNCRRLTWNPRYKGIDDWQLALRRQTAEKKEWIPMDFKQQYLRGLCGKEALDDCVNEWRSKHDSDAGLSEYLGFTAEEYDAMLQGNALWDMLNKQRRFQKFRIYQIDLNMDAPVPYAFESMEKLRSLGYEQPRASDYVLVYIAGLYCPVEQTNAELLDRIFTGLNVRKPNGYRGRSLSVSDIVEFFSDSERTYYYCDTESFQPTGFSPMLAKTMKSA